LSYETFGRWWPACQINWRKASVLLRPRCNRSCFQDRCSQLISACLPRAHFKSQIGDLEIRGLAARPGLAPGQAV